MQPVVPDIIGQTVWDLF